jgi:hypothetical protein
VTVVAVLVFVLVGAATPYSQQQLDHALTVIGAPPGFSGGQFSYEGGTFGSPPTSYRDYNGSGSVSQAHVYAWYVHRLAALGFQNVQGDGSAFCQRFAVGVSMESDDMIVGANVTSVEVSAQSQGISGSGAVCPSGLFG